MADIAAIGRIFIEHHADTGQGHLAQVKSIARPAYTATHHDHPGFRPTYAAMSRLDTELHPAFIEAL